MGPIVVDDVNRRDPCSFCGMRHRRGRLVFPKEKGVTKQKAKVVLEWLWIWLK